MLNKKSKVGCSVAFITIKTENNRFWKQIKYPVESKIRGYIYSSHYN